MKKAAIWIGTVLTAFIAAAFAVILDKAELTTDILIYLILLAILFLCIGFFGPMIYNACALKFHNTYGEFVFEKISTTLEYSDDTGNKVSHDVFVDISRVFLKFLKKKDPPFSLFSENGTIEASHGKSINADLSSYSNKMLTFKTHLKKDNVFDKKFSFGVSSTFLNEFASTNTQCWDIAPKYLCKKYVLTLIIPINDNMIDCQIMKSKKLKTNHASEYINQKEENKLIWEIQNDVGFIITNRYGMRVVKIILHNIKNTEAYRISWNFNES